ncbi:hypothetical protein [Herbiconiux ginsengi]|uniref:Integral membrane protein n=1 Tax=Herbiconiux ginsengi TaxID=381665 RepID=A0A1H3N681_9MICO|nr:hypothetical protein [Herbiconiux ginsengi]SDY84264.1 hypothetical protein SAMN05216554_1709 [Herbiconiux ginsengi]
MTTERDHGAERATKRDVERWLRSKGLPYFLPARVWADRLVVRIAPFLVFLLLADIPLSGLIRFHLVIDEDSPELDLLLLFVVLALAVLVMIAVPIVVASLAAGLLRRFPSTNLPVTLALLVGCLVGTPLVASLTSSGLDVVAAIVVNVAAVALAFLLTWVGVGALLGSAARTALRQLAAIGTLATRALPILMLVVVFAFFSRPLWEVTSTMQPVRLLAVGVFFVVLGLLFAVPITRTEMRDLAAVSGPPLGRIERMNIEAGFVLALGFQVLIFAALTCVFLLVLGALAFSSEVLEEWVGPRATTLTLFGIEVPFTWALLKTAIFLSCVSSLNFLVSVTTNRGYRTTFYEPLFHEAREALQVRAAYRTGTTWGDGASGSAHGGASGAASALDDDEESELLGIPEPGMVEPGRGSE